MMPSGTAADDYFQPTSLALPPNTALFCMARSSMSLRVRGQAGQD